MRGLAVPLIAQIAFAGCSLPHEDAGPREALDRYFAAARADDWEAFYELVGADFRQGRSPAEFREWAQAATPAFVRALTQRTTHEIAAVRIEGDRASVDVRLQTPDLQAIPGLQNRPPSEAEVLAAPLVSASQTFDLLREEGEWRIILAPPSQPDPELIDRLERGEGRAE